MHPVWFDVWCREVPLIVTKVTGNFVTKSTTADGLASLPQLFDASFKFFSSS